MADDWRNLLIVDYDPSWPQRFEAERDAMVASLGEAMAGVAGIEHVGSTSVPGCAAKPIIDIMIGVRALVDALRCITPVVQLGYDCVGEYGIPGRVYFRKGVPRTHHVHLVEQGSEFWERHLLFRDTLRGSPGLVEQYSALKRDLAFEYGDDRVGYTEAKTPFIEAALAEADRPRPR